MNQDTINISELEPLIFPNDPSRDKTPVYTVDGNKVHARFAVMKMGAEQFNLYYSGDQNYKIITREFGFRGRVQNYYLLSSVVLYKEWLEEHRDSEICPNCHDMGITIEGDRRTRCPQCQMGELVKRYFYEPSVIEEMEQANIKERVSEKCRKEIGSIREELKQRTLGNLQSPKGIDSQEEKG